MNNETGPLVSVIIPAFNAQQFIAAAIQSVIHQTLQHFEVIIVNDGSTDSTASIVASFCENDPRIRLITQPNGKLSKARNTGLDAASGEFVAFLDADDIWQPTKLEKQLQIWRQTKADVVFSDAFHFPENIANLPTHLFGAFFGFLEGSKMFPRLYNGNAIPISSALLHFSQLGKQCVFDESPEVRGVEDYELWLRLSSKGVNFFGLNEKLVGYRSHPGQMSRRVILMLRSAIAVRRKYRSVAQAAGIDVLAQDRTDYRNLAYCSCNEGNRELTWSSIAALCDFGRFGVAGWAAALGATLHALYHLIKKPENNFR